MNAMITVDPEIMIAIRTHNTEHPELNINISGVCRNALKDAHDKVIGHVDKH